MDFSIQLSAYYPDKAYGGRRLYQDMLEQAVLGDRLGYDAVSLTEHHLINILLMPAPLQFAVKIADATERIKIMTSVAVLPLHDMRIYAGEVVCADIFTEGRLMLGVGRGAFGFEMERLGVPLAISREKFDESLDVLTALLREEEVSWDGKYYKFDPLTVMPRPHAPRRPADHDGRHGARGHLPLHQAGLPHPDHAALRRPCQDAGAGGRLQPRQGGTGRGRRGAHPVALPRLLRRQIDEADRQRQDRGRPTTTTAASTTSSPAPASWRTA